MRSATAFLIYCLKVFGIIETPVSTDFNEVKLEFLYSEIAVSLYRNCSFSIVKFEYRYTETDTSV